MTCNCNSGECSECYSQLVQSDFEKNPNHRHCNCMSEYCRICNFYEEKLSKDTPISLYEKDRSNDRHWVERSKFRAVYDYAVTLENKLLKLRKAKQEIRNGAVLAGASCGMYEHLHVIVCDEIIDGGEFLAVVIADSYGGAGGEYCIGEVRSFIARSVFTCLWRISSLAEAANAK